MNKISFAPNEMVMSRSPGLAPSFGEKATLLREHFHLTGGEQSGGSGGFPSPSEMEAMLERPGVPGEIKAAARFFLQNPASMERLHSEVDVVQGKDLHNVQERGGVASTKKDAYASSSPATEMKILSSGYHGQKLSGPTVRPASASAYRSSHDMSSEIEREAAYNTLIKLKHSGVLTDEMFQRLAQPLLEGNSSSQVTSERQAPTPELVQMKESKPYEGGKSESEFKAAKRAAMTSKSPAEQDVDVANEAAFKAAKRAKMNQPKEQPAVQSKPQTCKTKPSSKAQESEPSMTMDQVVDILKRHFSIAAASSGDRSLISRNDLEALQDQPAIPKELKRAARFLLDNKAFFNALEIKGAVIAYHDGQIAMGDLNAYKA